MFHVEQKRLLRSNFPVDRKRELWFNISTMKTPSNIREWSADEAAHLDRCMRLVAKLDQGQNGDKYATLKAYWQGGLDLLTSLHAFIEGGALDNNQAELPMPEGSNAHARSVLLSDLEAFVRAQQSEIESARRALVPGKRGDETRTHYNGQAYAFGQVLEWLKAEVIR